MPTHLLDIAHGGGFPIMVAGEVIGAVAAGGAKIEQDVIVAKAAQDDLPPVPTAARDIGPLLE